jgi:hypothetical protein
MRRGFGIDIKVFSKSPVCSNNNVWRGRGDSGVIHRVFSFSWEKGGRLKQKKILETTIIIHRHVE